MNKKRKSKFVGPCVILYLPTSIEPLRFEHRRNRTKRQYYRRRALGSIKNRKTVEKNHTKLQRKNCSKPITACKTIKTNKVSHSSYPNPNRSNTEVKSGAKRDFRRYERSVEAEKLPLRSKENRKTKKEKPKTTSNIKSEKQMLKSGKSANRN